MTRPDPAASIRQAILSPSLTRYPNATCRSGGREAATRPSVPRTWTISAAWLSDRSGTAEKRNQSAMVATDSTSETVTILFTDLVGSTEIAGALGEEKSNAHRRLHFRLLREAIRDYRGHEVKSLGDGVMAVFPSAAEAVYCAVAMQKAAEKHNAGAEIACLDIRIGIHTGEPIHEDDDYFGTPVVIASRLTGQAQGAQILISDVARRVAGRRAGLQFQDRGLLPLKGLADHVNVVEVDWRASRLPRRAASFRTIGRASSRLPRAWLYRQGRWGRLIAAVSALGAVTVIVLVLVFAVGGGDDRRTPAAGDDEVRVLEGLQYREELVYPNGTFVMGDSEESTEGIRVSAVWSTPDDPDTIFAFYEEAFRELGFDKVSRISTPALESLTVGEGSDAALVIVEPSRGLDGENRITVAFTLR